MPLDRELCYDSAGDLLAYCWSADGCLHVDLPDLASFRYDEDAHAVTAVPHVDLTREFLLDTYHHCVVPLLLPALGTSVVHASAVVGPNGVAAFCGTSGTGKSTVAAALVQRGYDQWADDAVALDTAPPRPFVIPLPFVARLEPDAAQFLRDTNRQSHPRPESHEAVAPAPLSLLCLLRRAPDAAQPVAIERVDPAAACRAALSHAYFFSVKDPAQKRRTVETYLTLTSRVPVYEVQFRPGFEHLAVVLDAIEDLMR